MEKPRLLLEYLAAGVQSSGRISANADVDVRSAAKIDNVIARMTDNLYTKPKTLRRLTGGCRRFVWGLWSVSVLRSLRPGTHRQITRSQFLDIRQFVQLAQTEVVQKKLRCFVKQRPAGNFGAPGYFYQAALHQSLQHAVDRHAAHSFDIGARDRLAIGNDGKRFERGRGQPRRFRRRKKLAHPLRTIRIGDELPAFGFFDELEGAILRDVIVFQLFERGRDFGFADLCEFVRRKLIFGAGAPRYIDNLFCRERLLRTEQKRLYYSIECHLVRSDRGLNCVGNSVGLFVDLVQFAAFDEQPDLRLRPGITQ